MSEAGLTDISHCDVVVKRFHGNKTWSFIKYQSYLHFQNTQPVQKPFYSQRNNLDFLDILLF